MITINGHTVTPESEARRVQPFQEREVRKPSLLARLFGSLRTGDAEAAIENLIAERGLENLDVAALDNCLDRYGVRNSAVKPLLLNVWRHAVERFIATDHTLDDAEADFLERLKDVLGLGEVEANSERDSILIDEFMNRARRLISRLDAETEETRSRISQIARQFEISPDKQKSLLKPLAQAAFDSICKYWIRERRINDATYNALLVFKDEYDLSLAGSELLKLTRCRELNLLDAGTLPSPGTEVFGNANEKCYFFGYSVLLEPREGRPNGMSCETLQEVDRGLVYITNERILFVGHSERNTMWFSSVIRAFANDSALVIQRTTGKSQHFLFDDDLDLEAAGIILQELCGTKKLSPRTENSIVTGDTPMTQVMPPRLEETVISGY
jgi:hypothetical protein